MFAVLLLISLALCSGSLASPQRYRAPTSSFGRSSGPFIPILRDERNGPRNGVYDFRFETGNGIRRQEQGAPTGPNGAVESSGSWDFTFPDGSPAKFSFVADRNGYRVDSPLLPTPPPLPQHAIEQIRRAGQASSRSTSFSGSRANTFSAPRSSSRSNHFSSSRTNAFSGSHRSSAYSAPRSNHFSAPRTNHFSVPRTNHFSVPRRNSFNRSNRRSSGRRSYN